MSSVRAAKATEILVKVQANARALASICQRTKFRDHFFTPGCKARLGTFPRLLAKRVQFRLEFLFQQVLNFQLPAVALPVPWSECSQTTNRRQIRTRPGHAASPQARPIRSGDNSFSNPSGRAARDSFPLKLPRYNRHPSSFRMIYLF